MRTLQFPKNIDNWFCQMIIIEFNIGGVSNNGPPLGMSCLSIENCKWSVILCEVFFKIFNIAHYSKHFIKDHHVKIVNFAPKT